MPEPGSRTSKHYWEYAKWNKKNLHLLVDVTKGGRQKNLPGEGLPNFGSKKAIPQVTIHVTSDGGSNQCKISKEMEMGFHEQDATTKRNTYTEAIFYPFWTEEDQENISSLLMCE